MDETAAKRIIRRHGWLAAEAEWVQNAILESARLKSFVINQAVYQFDDDPGGLYGVVDGGFGLSLPSGAREMALAHIVRRGVWFGHKPFLEGGTRTLSVRAIEPSLALHVPLSAIIEIGRHYPEFQRRIAALSEHNNNAATHRVIGDLMIGSGEKRIAATLARISKPERSQSASLPWPIRLTQAEIGQMANASRDSVNRALTKFEAKGWITVDYKIITVTDLAALEAHACT
jgi:CRP/FNR family transcriptional regulator, cyclic AMP receptor protein